MKLSDYLSIHGISQAEFARIIDESPQNVERYTNDKRKPIDQAVMLRIYKATSGQVTANDFYNLPTEDRSHA